jgi:DNA-binding MarR family transcriptional regulator
VQGDLVAIGVGEGERPTEGPVDRGRDDRVTVGDERIVDGLDVRGVEPDRGADARLHDGCEIGAGNHIAECERDWLGLKDDGVWRSGRRADEAEVPELARGAFVTRQSMNVLLQSLERDGFVTRPAEARVGKVLPTRLTPRGRRSLEKATVAVRSVELRMLAGMSETDQSEAFRILQGMLHSLRDSEEGSG